MKNNVSKVTWLWWFILYIAPQEANIINTLRPRQDGRYFADDVLKCIFLNENVWISLKIPLKLVPSGPINNIPALVQIMAWHRPGDKPLSESMLVFVPTYICVTPPQWVNENIWFLSLTASQWCHSFTHSTLNIFISHMIMCLHFVSFHHNEMLQVVQITLNKEKGISSSCSQ